MAPAPGPALLIALTGSPGEGRTRLLAEFAAERRMHGQIVAGFLAVAGPRPTPNSGADFYRLHLLGESGDRPWAERDDALIPPYRFDAGTFAHVANWARALRDQPRLDLLILDEFGRFEAKGEGWWPLWNDLAAAAPRIVVLSVREGCVPELEQRLGRKFDLVLPVSDTRTPERLRQACAEFGEWTQVGLWGGAAGTIEMTFGSVLHAMKIPLRGAAMCSIQAATLTFASARLTPPGRVVWVALIAAGLKAFSPGGGRVRPMVAISVQGSLFASAVQLLGWNFLSVLIGGAAVGSWAALQGFLLQYLLLGDDLIAAYAKAAQWLRDTWQLQAPSLPVVIVAWAALHAALAAAAALGAWRLRAPPKKLREILERESADAALKPAPTFTPTATDASPRAAPALPLYRRVAREFARWHFWVPLVVVAAVLLAAGRSWENVGWLVLRFVAVGAVLFSLLSFFQPARFAAHLRRRGWWGPAAAFSEALERRRR